MDQATYDVIIIGGGPAGAAAGLTLTRHGLKSVILEKTRHPRFHIGESLLPRNYSLLQEMGLEHKMAGVPHVPKYGAEFGMGGGTETSRFQFDDGFQKNQQTFNVERALFDKMVLDSAREEGTEIREDVAVKKILKLEDGDVRVELDTGEQLAGKWLFDASGQSTVVGRHLNIRKPPSERHLQKVAHFAHFEGVTRLPGREQGHPLIVMCDEGWFWVIHINDRITSIGLVMDAELSRKTGIPADKMLHWGMQRCPLIRERCKNATGPTTNQTIANFSYRCDPFAGPGYFLLGDAAAFVDPIFSTGVCLAMMEARRASDHVKNILAGKISPAASRKDYIRFAVGASSIYFGMIRQFYRHSFRELFLNGQGPYRVHTAVLSVLAGHVFPRPKWKLVWRNWLFRRFIQINERFQLVPKRPKHSLLNATPEPVGRIGQDEVHAAHVESMRAPAIEPATAGVE